MKKSLVCFFLFTFSFHLFSQPYGNEWIKNNQKYFKIPIGKSGIYRLDYTSLIPAATDMKLDLSTVKPKKWQMFYKGKEIPIYVSGEGDNIFNNYDFIEFYATLNDGSLDKELYADSSFVANDRVSMITDSSFYYLTFLPASSAQNGWHMLNYKNTAFSTYPSEPYFIHESLVNFLNEYNRGRKFSVGTSEAENPEYTKTEGYCSTFFGSGTSYNNQTATLETRFMNTNGPLPTYSFASVGANDNKNVNIDHRFKLGISTDNFTFQNVLDTSFDGFEIIRNTRTIDYSYIGANSTFIRFDVQFIPGVSYQAHGINFVSVKYPRYFDLNGASRFKFSLNSNSNPRHIEWSNYASTRVEPIMYDLSNGYRIRAEKFNTTYSRCIVPASSKNVTDYFLCDSSEIIFLQANDVLPAISYEAAFNPLITYNPTTTINSNKLILLTHPKLIGDGLNKYLTFKSSSTYASPCDVVGIQQLYDHFSYGIPHPIAISHYLRYLKEKGDTTLKFLFLVGRGYQTNLLRPGAYNKNIIPSIGVPASDNLFATEMLDSNLVPQVAIGRLTVDRENDFSAYVNKLMEYDATSNEFWKKSVLHLAGGDNGNQANYIKSRLDNAAGVVQSPPFGGKAVTYTKSSVGISEPFLKQKAIDNVNQGMQLITFLGHGSAATTDIDIGDTIEYNNYLKYPVFYFNGCSIGNPCTGPPDKNIKLSGENFMKARGRGAIAFIAQSGLSELGQVDDQIQSFYSFVFNRKYTGNYTVGEAIIDMLRATGNYNDELNRIQSRELILQGDPSIQWFQPILPDYSIDEKSIFLYPNNLTAVSDSFAVAVAIENRGRFSEDSINIKIDRFYPNNFIVTEHHFKVQPIGYKDTVYLYIKAKDAAAAGINRFVVTINEEHKPVENNYTNNVATISPYIPGNGINLVHPKRFDIVSNLNNDTVELIAQALNLFEKNYQFIFEIDTSYLFNSPWKKTDNSGSIVGQLKSWKVKLLGQKDSTVYYWRAMIKTGSIQGGYFTERSFIHILSHSPGWSQSDFPQFYPSSTLNNIVLEKNSEKFAFSNTSEKIYVNCYTPKRPNTGIKKGGQGAMSLTPGTYDGSVVAILFDKNNLEQFKLPGIFNPNRYYNGGLYEDNVKAYNFTFFGNWDQPQFVRWVDSIPDSTYVALCNMGAMFRTRFSPQVLTAFSKLGAKLVNDLKTDYTSYAMIGKKGAVPGWALEDSGHYKDGNEGYIQIEKELIGKRGTGTLRTELIGPTTKWGNLYFYTKPEENNSADQFAINVHAVSNSGQDTVIYSNVETNNFDLSNIDAKRFPNIYLEGLFEDLKEYTPPQIKHWRVGVTPVPEGSINPNLSNNLWRDTLRQGEDFKFEIGFQNISNLSFDKNLKYQVLIYNVDTKDTVYNSISNRTDSLKPNAFFIINTLKNTKNMRGRYAFALLVNFDNNNRSIQPEMSLTNNSALRYFYVNEDKINPLLDVTFDGKHIGNGEIVSGSPVISISSKDENKLNWQTDTNGIQIWLKRPNSVNFEPINFDTFGVKFYPATSAYNLAKAEFNPKNLSDGIYTLKVQSNDANGTKAGNTEYMINFTVINKASATNFYPYPNPFTTSMRFVYTLTGNQVPDYINVKIMTIQGKVVKELNKDDLGDVHIGNNISEVVWDGTDEYGDRLSNGVYLYVVTIKLNGEEITQLESDNVSNDLNADKANNNLFKHSTGKIVLLR